jgi:hypothetical protein
MGSIMSRILRKATTVMDTTPSALGPKRSESDMERRTRKERKFDETESQLPNVKVSAIQDRPEIATNLLSYLGSWNPIPLQISKTDTVWLFDNTAYRNPITNNWEAEFVAAVFEKGTGVEVSSVVADLAEKLGIGKGDAAEDTIQERLLPFMRSILPGRVVHVEFPGTAALKLGPGGRNGISIDIKQVPKYKDGDIVQATAKVASGANGILEMKTAFAEPEGWAVISGI